MTGVSLMLARDHGSPQPVGFSLFRTVAGEAELLLLAVAPDHQGRGIGRLLLDEFVDRARAAGASRVHLEVRDGNPAVAMYRARRFHARRPPPQILSRQRRQPIRRADIALATCRTKRSTTVFGPYCAKNKRRPNVAVLQWRRCSALCSTWEISRCSTMKVPKTHCSR